MLLENKDILKKYDIVLLVNKRFAEIFKTFSSKIKLVICNDDIGIIGALFRSVLCCIKYRIKYVFPLRPFRFLKIFGITPVSWIADFQHCHYPDFFGQAEINKRNKVFKQIIKSDTPLVLSSEDALKDLHTYFSSSRNNVFVVHFTSYIEDDLNELKKLDENIILDHFGLKKGQYIAICNQFWKHKNHMVVLNAIKLLSQERDVPDVRFVFTGELSDRRDPAYIQEIKTILADSQITDHVKVLGFIDRMTQLCIMKNASFLIQPSLFEGWGTVVEDGKVLNKRMILSDIDVHMEQKNENCLLFHKDDPEDLANAIKKVLSQKDKSTFKYTDMTAKYAEVLGQIFV